MMGELLKERERMPAGADGTEVDQVEAPSVWALCKFMNEMLRSQQFERAIATLTEVIRYNPHLGILYAYRGIAFYELGYYGEAFLDEEAALRMNPDDPETLFNQAEALFKLGNDERALWNLDRALELANHRTERKQIIECIQHLAKIIRDKEIPRELYYQNMASR